LALVLAMVFTVIHGEWALVASADSVVLATEAGAAACFLLSTLHGDGAAVLAVYMAADSTVEASMAVDSTAVALEAVIMAVLTASTDQGQAEVQRTQFLEEETTMVTDLLLEDTMATALLFLEEGRRDTQIELVLADLHPEHNNQSGHNLQDHQDLKVTLLKEVLKLDLILHQQAVAALAAAAVVEVQVEAAAAVAAVAVEEINLDKIIR